MDPRRGRASNSGGGGAGGGLNCTSHLPQGHLLLS